MSSFESKWSIVLVIAAMAACSPSTSIPARPGGGGEPSGSDNPGTGDDSSDSEREWCPHCVAGGQTGDFGGSASSCMTTQKPLTAEIAKRFGIDDWRARVENPFRAPLRWVVDQNEAANLGRTPSPYLELPSGYDEQTMIEGKVTLDDPPMYFAAEGDGSGCEDTVAMPAQVELATADGALARIVTRGSFVIGSSALSPAPWLIARAALADAHGSLDLHLDPDATFGSAPADAPLEALGDPPTLDVFMNFFPDGVKSFMRPNIGLQIIVEGQWPDDDCGELAIAVDGGDKQPWFNGATFAEIYQDWKKAIDDLPPTRGRWLDGSDVDVHVELGVAPKRACLDTHVGFTFQSESRLVTSDGRVMAKLTQGSMFGDTLSLSSRDTNTSSPPQIDPGEFAKQTGIRGVDAAGSPYLSPYFEANYTRDAGAIRAEGSLEVDGEPMCQKADGRCTVDPQVAGAGVECLQWPPQDAFPEPCGRQLR
jgi:hypothetical protein